jgi:polyisoprenoid-binding protein YceI
MRVAPQVLVFLLAATLGANAHAKKFENDGNHTIIGFKASTVLFDVDGRFNKYNLAVEGDPEKPGAARISLVIDAASIDTGNKKRDDHLRTPDFFDVKKFPRITFTASSASREGDKVVVDGTLEMHGVKKPVKLVFTQVAATNGAGVMEHVYKTELALNRKDFGIGVDSVAAKISLADTVTVKILLAGFFE